MKRLLLLLSFLAILWPNIVVGQESILVSQVYNEGDDGRPYYNIGIKYSGPFAYLDTNDREWKGLSVDLIAMLAERLNFSYRFVGVDTVPKLLNLAAEEGKVNFSIGAISMTDEREKVLDFSHPYFTTTQGILAQENGSYFWFIGKKVLKAVGVLLVVAVVVGFIISRVNRRDDIKTTEDGAWFTIVTATTTGYGDLVPKGHAGRLFAVVLMLSSMFLMPVFTSHITSALTVEKLSNDVTSLADLATSKTVTISGTTSDDLLGLVGIDRSYVGSIKAGVEKVKSGDAKAFVYDKAMLDYLAQKEDNTSLVVHPINSGQERYAIAFPSGSELRESFNVAILDIIDSKGWRQLTTQYFGN